MIVVMSYDKNDKKNCKNKIVEKPLLDSWGNQYLSIYH